MAYLDDNPPNRSQGYPRSEPPTCIVLHTVEIAPGELGEADGNAEAAARYAAVRDTPGSYHSVNDLDSTIDLLIAAKMTALGARYGFNAFSIHHSMATQADDYIRDDGWTMTDGSRRSGYAIGAAARCAEYCVEFDIPAVRITREEALDRRKGILGHTDADPWRRHDPGFSEAEWDMWLTVVAHRIQELKRPPATQPKRRPVGHVTPATSRLDTATWRWPLWSWYADGEVLARYGAEWHDDARKFEKKAPISAMVSTATGNGYWLIGGDGGVFTFGDAWYPPSHPDFMAVTAPHLVGEIVHAILHQDRLVLTASDGGVFVLGR